MVFYNFVFMVDFSPRSLGSQGVKDMKRTRKIAERWRCHHQDLRFVRRHVTEMSRMCIIIYKEIFRRRFSCSSALSRSKMEDVLQTN